MRFLLGLVLALLIAAATAYYISGRGGGPTVEFAKPEKFVGASTPVEVVLGVPAAQLTSLTLTLEQNGKTFPVYTLGAEGGTMKDEADGRSRLVVSVLVAGVREPR